MIQTGIFSGSFNPIHIGHLALANWLCEYTELDEVWFMITPQNPHKKEEDLMDSQLRLQMAQIAIADYPKFKVCDFEFTLPQPNYTIKTLDLLTQKYPGHQFNLIIGADNWSKINTWKESERLLKEYPLIVYPRKGYTIENMDQSSNVTFVDAPEIEISATFIRKSIRKGKDVRFFLPEKIWQIMLKS